MPYLRIQTNQTVDNSRKSAILSRASRLVASELGKPESYVMTSCAPTQPMSAPTQPMSFAGNMDACAYLELKSIGLPENKTTGLSAALCKLINEELDIPGERIYIEFVDVPRAMWGWNNATF